MNLLSDDNTTDNVGDKDQIIEQQERLNKINVGAIQVLIVQSLKKDVRIY